MPDTRPSPEQCVLRALHAAEIADSCPDPDLREAFFELSGTWLDMAAGEAQPAAPLPGA